MVEVGGDLTWLILRTLRARLKPTMQDIAIISVLSLNMKSTFLK